MFSPLVDCGSFRNPQALSLSPLIGSMKAVEDGHGRAVKLLRVTQSTFGALRQRIFLDLLFPSQGFLRHAFYLESWDFFAFFEEIERRVLVALNIVNPLHTDELFIFFDYHSTASSK